MPTATPKKGSKAPPPRFPRRPMMGFDDPSFSRRPAGPTMGFDDPSFRRRPAGPTMGFGDPRPPKAPTPVKPPVPVVVAAPRRPMIVPTPSRRVWVPPRPLVNNFGDQRIYGASAVATRAARAAGLNLKDSAQWARARAAGNSHIGIGNQHIDYGGIGHFFTWDGVPIGPAADNDTIRQLNTAAHSGGHGRDFMEKVAKAFIGTAFAVVSFGAATEALGGTEAAAGAAEVGGAEVAAGEVATGEVTAGEVAAEVSATEGVATGGISGGSLASTATSAGQWLAKEGGKAVVAAAVSKSGKSKNKAPSAGVPSPVAPQQAALTAPAPGLFEVIGEFVVTLAHTLTGKK